MRTKSALAAARRRAQSREAKRIGKAVDDARELLGLCSWCDDGKVVEGKCDMCGRTPPADEGPDR